MDLCEKCLGFEGELLSKEVVGQEEEHEELKTELREKQQKESMATLRALLRQFEEELQHVTANVKPLLAEEENS